MKMRHRITIQSKVSTVNPATGYPTLSWVDRVANEPADWMAGPGREYLAGEAIRAAVVGRFRIRWNPVNSAILSGDRVVWDGRTMEIKAPPQPDETARRELLLMVAEAGTDGA